jgi:hypothetical protein
MTTDLLLGVQITYFNLHSIDLNPTTKYSDYPISVGYGDDRFGIRPTLPDLGLLSLTSISTHSVLTLFLYAKQFAVG